MQVFGTVIEGQVELTPLGQATWDCWYAIPEHFSFVLLDEFVAMPNHVHGIVIIDKPKRDVIEVYNAVSFGPQSQNLASILRGFKIGVTKYARQHQMAFAW